MKRLVAVDPSLDDRDLEPGLRGPEAEALLAAHGRDPGPLPAVVRVRHDRRLRGHPLQRPVVAPATAASTRWWSGSRVATPRGEVRLGSAPTNAAGPDLRQLFLGSEGAFGVITSVTVRVRRLPEVKVYEGWRWDSFAAGADAMRTLAQSGLLPTVLRLSDEAETAINLARPDADRRRSRRAAA